MHPTRIFKTPEDLAKAWEEFKKDLKEQARDWPKVQYVGKDGERMVDYPVIPITLEGFYRFCRGKYGDVKEYFVNRPNDGKRYYDEFTTICHACKDECREHQIIGGMIGNFNPSITQRLNGLKEHTDTVSVTSVQILNIDPLSSIE